MYYSTNGDLKNKKNVEGFLNIPLFQFVSSKNAGVTSTSGLKVSGGDSELQNVILDKLDCKSIKSDTGNFNDLIIESDILTSNIDSNDIKIKKIVSKDNSIEINLDKNMVLLGKKDDKTKARIKNNGNYDNASFTGQHRCLFENNIDDINKYIGLIVECTGDYSNLDNSTNVKINESLPIVKLSEKQKNKNVFGVISNIEDDDETRSYGLGVFETINKKEITNERRLFINSLGEGGIWVLNTNGPIEKGDYITTSSLGKGYGRKQSDDLLHNYTVAKATCDCDFSLNMINKKRLKCKVINNKNEIEYENNKIKFEENNNFKDYKFDTKFINNKGNIISKDEYQKSIDKKENVYIACFIGCTYHCG